MKLIELGFPPDSADFMWVKLDLIKPQLILRSMESHYSDLHYKKIPAWSLSALVNFLPADITVSADNEEISDLAFDYDSHYPLKIEKSDNEGYTITYSAGDETLFITVKEDFVSAVVKTLEWIVKDWGWPAPIIMDWVQE